MGIFSPTLSSPVRAFVNSLTDAKEIKKKKENERVKEKKMRGFWQVNRPKSVEQNRLYGCRAGRAAVKSFFENITSQINNKKGEALEQWLLTWGACTPRGVGKRSVPQKARFFVIKMRLLYLFFRWREGRVAYVVGVQAPQRVKNRCFRDTSGFCSN